MIKRAILELIQHRLRPLDETEHFPLSFIEGMCDLAWESWCNEASNNPKDDVGFYTKLYDSVAVQENVEQNYYYAILPVGILNLNRIGDGVISINQVEAIDNDFKPLSERDFRLIKGQEVNRTGSDIYYFVTYDRVYFSDSMTDDIASVGVDMNLVIPFSSYEDTERLPFPSGKALEFVKMVIDIIQGTPEPDLTNKNSSK